MTTVTIDLPQELFRQANQVAKSTKRPLEQVVVEWIKPSITTTELNLKDEVLQMMKQLSNDELVRFAKARAPENDSLQLRTLLELQQTRKLTANERAEAELLVNEEDKLTFRKACALYELKLRNLLPADIQTFLANP